MRTDKKTIEELERLMIEYEEEVERQRRKGRLSKNTAITYLLHPNNFIRWCKGEFFPGKRNE